MTSTRIERCDGLTRAEGIQALFARNGRPAFAQFFRRAYGGVTGAGGGSWVGLDPQGTVVMHMAVFPRVFRSRSLTMRAGLVGDLMVDAPLRNFWAPLSLFRTAVADIRQEGVFDFLYTDPIPVSTGIVKAVGFVPLGQLCRHVLPLNGVYLLLGRLRAPGPQLVADRLPGTEPDRVVSLLEALQPGAALRAVRTLEIYGARLGEEGVGRADWRVLSPPAGSGSPVGLVLLTSAPRRRLVVLDVLWADRQVEPEAVLLAVARAVRRDYRTLQLTTLARSRVAEAAGRVGFVSRPDAQPVVVCALRDELRLPPLRDWYLNSVDGSAW